LQPHFIQQPGGDLLMNRCGNVDDVLSNLVLRFTLHFSWRSLLLGQSKRFGSGKLAKNEPGVSDRFFSFFVMRLMVFEGETLPTDFPEEPR